MLCFAAALQVAAAAVALMLIPIVTVGMRKSWLVSWVVICVALVLQAYRRVIEVGSGGDMLNAATALAVSVLLLAGIIGIRTVFIALRRDRYLLDEESRRGLAVSNAAGAAIVVLDTAGKLREVNDAARELLRLTDRPVEGVDWFETFVDPEIRPKVRETFDRFVMSKEGNDEYLEYPVTDLAGKQHSIVWLRRLLWDADGRPTGVRSAGVDLTDRTVLEKDLAFRSVLLDHTNDSVLVYRFDGVIVYANTTACDYRGVRRENIIGTNARLLMPVANRDAFAIHLETVRSGACVTYETEAVGRDGRVRPLESNVCAVSLGEEQVVVDVSRDITDRREAEAAVRRMAYTDHLTGLANRARLEDRVSVSIARARRTGELIAVLFMDLDRIKSVNDTFGHRAGDELLCTVGERLTGFFRAEDTVARIGGDEFVAFTRVADTSDAEGIADRLVKLIAEPFDIGDKRIPISASVGVAIFPRSGEDLETLMAKADAAMYTAKDQGRNRYASDTSATAV
jgi:diguanylate cyclase (GGDEF)-like protein/PAS domain S-box-containing protein